MCGQPKSYTARGEPHGVEAVHDCGNEADNLLASVKANEIPNATDSIGDLRHTLCLRNLWSSLGQCQLRSKPDTRSCNDAYQGALHRFRVGTNDHVDPAFHSDPTPYRQPIEFIQSQSGGIIQVNHQTATANVDAADVCRT